MKLFIFSVVIFYSTLSCANCKPLPLSIPSNTILFFYAYEKEHAMHYLPLAQLVNGKLAPATTSPSSTMTLYDLRDNKPISVYFTNVWDNMLDTCVSWGKSQTFITSTNLLYATQPLAKAFNFNPSKTQVRLFQQNINHPCQADQKKYDHDGIALCDNDTLIATSHLSRQTQYWHTKQFRYDIGFAVDRFNQHDKRLIPIADDCSLCAD